MHRTTIVGFICILLLIAGGAIWYLVASSKGIAHTKAPVATTTDTIVSGDAIYTNGPYGFVIQYPESAEVENTFSSYYHLNSDWRASALPNATGTAIVSFATYSTKSENSYPRYYATLVRVGASADPKEVAGCLKASPNQGETQLPDASFGGATWKVFSFQSAGMMQYVKGVSYRTLHEGQCVALEQIAVGSSYRDDPTSSKDIADTVLNKEYDALDRVVHTFSFVRP